MKIVYTIPSVVARAGVERVLANKTNYLADKMGMEIVVITTDQKGRPPAFMFSDRVKFVDLGLNYQDQRKKHSLAKWYGVRNFERSYRKALKKILLEENPDVTVSVMLGKEKSWLCRMPDRSRKVLEFHFSKEIIYPDPRFSLLRMLKLYRRQRIFRMCDRFVVLTDEDKVQWGEMRNAEVIPNAVSFFPANAASLTDKRVLAVGRLVKDKGFDRLIDVWFRVSFGFPDWKLSIYGEGPEYARLQEQICCYGLESTVEIFSPVLCIADEFLRSGVYVLPSRLEAFGMVLVEAMACGLPPVSFDCGCGPREIIRNGENGFLVENGNLDEFAGRLAELMGDQELRVRLGQNARHNVARFREEIVMEKWGSLFANLAGGDWEIN